MSPPESRYSSHRTPSRVSPQRESVQQSAQMLEDFTTKEMHSMTNQPSDFSFTVNPEAAVSIHEDRKSTRLNSSHGYISYAVFCLKKKKRPQDRISATLHTPSATSSLSQYSSF